MKQFILFTLVVLLVVGCAQPLKHTTTTKLTINSYDTVENGNSTPVSFDIKPPLSDGDYLVMKYKKEPVIAAIIKGDINLSKLALRFRAMGSDNIVVSILEKNHDHRYSWYKPVTVKSFNKIPAENSSPFGRKIYFDEVIGTLKVIINNDSAEKEYVQSVLLNYGSGTIEILGSKLLAPDPYFIFTTGEGSPKPAVTITLAE